MIAVSSFTFQNTWVLAGCAAVYLALRLWSQRSVRRGKPAIPGSIALLIPLGVYLFFLQLSLPLASAPDEDTKPPSSYSLQNEVLRHDLDRALRDLDQLNSLHQALLNLGLMVVIIVVLNWLQPRMDDRNWIHGGIRPRPDSPADPTSPPPPSPPP
jgi:hypothetical protein